MPRLLLKKRAEVIAEYRIASVNVINIGSVRANEIVVKDKNASENHCAITKVNGSYEIKDNNTLTGTLLNGKQITISELNFGDEIGIGNHTIVFLPDARKIFTGQDAKDFSSSEFREKNHFLLGVYGKFEGKKYQIRNSGTFIGRERISPKGVENNVVLTGDMTVSKGHARIELRDNNYMLKDVGSTGGVAINGKKVGQLNEIAIKNGDEIAVGRSIFRFVDDGNDDYSLPKNHRIFLLKIRGPLITFLVLLSLGCSVFLGYTGIEGIKISKAQVMKISFEVDTKWVPYGISNRSVPQEYDVSASAAIGDVNGDGVNDVVYMSPSGLLYAWDGKTGVQLWKPVEIYNSGKCSPVLYDMNKDGILDIIVVSDTSLLYIVDGKSGGMIRKEVLGGAVSELSPAVGDLDGDGKPDVVVCSEDGMVHFLYAPGFDSEFQKFTEYVEGPIYASPVILSTEKISPMVVVCSYNSKVFFFDGKNRSKKTVDLVEKTGKAHLITCPPAVGDINGDGVPEVVVHSSIPEYVSAIDINTFAVNWTYFVEPIAPNGIKHNSSPVLTDVDGDRLSDVVFTSPNGFLYALKGKTGYPAGELLSKIKVPDGGRLVGGISMYDFDKNGFPSLVFGTENGEIIITRSRPQSKEIEISENVKVSNDPITSTVLIGDVSGAGRIGLLYSNTVNSIQILRSNLRTFKNKLVWPAYLGGPSRTGSQAIREDRNPYILRLGIGIFIIIFLIIISFVRRGNRYSKRPRTVYL